MGEHGTVVASAVHEFHVYRIKVLSAMWQDLEFYILHYHRLVGLPGYCAIIMIAVASWFAFYREDRRTGFELLIVTWLILCFGIVWEFLWSILYVEIPFIIGDFIRGLHEALLGAVVPFLLTVPVAVHLLSDTELRSRRLHRLLLAGAIAALLDAVFLFLSLLWLFGMSR